MKWTKQKKRNYNSDRNDKNHLETVLSRIEDTYKFIERREVTVKNAEDLPQLGGIYSAQMIKYSKKSSPNSDVDDEIDDDDDRPNRILKLPSDGSIFHDGIPFHHFSLSNLKERHVNRLKKNGIDIKPGKFSKAEDDKLRENWLSYASAYNISEDEVPRYIGAGAATETSEESRERINLIRSTLFRPWICSKLLNRTAQQVFRRCYHLYRVSKFQMEDLREWTSEDDKKLLEIVQMEGDKWEYIGNELLHPRYSCYRRYNKLMGRECEPEEWNRVEIARLYNYLADHLPRHPVIIAIVSKYQHLDSHIDWSAVEFRLPLRSDVERKAKWEDLRRQFQAAKERTQSDSIKEILREVIPEDTRVISKAKTIGYGLPKRTHIKPSQVSEEVLSLLEFCIENEIERKYDIRKEHVDVIFATAHKTDRSSSRFLNCVKYMLFLGQKMGLFRMLPLGEDKLFVHLEMLAFILNKIEKFKVKKKVLRKYARKFIRSKGWERRKALVFVQRKPEEMKEYDEASRKLIHLLSTHSQKSFR